VTNDEGRETRISCLYVVPGPTFGGPHNEIVQLQRSLQGAGFRSIVALPPEPGSARDRLRAAGVVVLQPKMVRLRRVRSARHWLWYPFGFVRDVAMLTRLIRRRGIGLVHGYGPNLQGAIAAKLTGTPVVWTLNDIGAPSIVRLLIGKLLPALVDSVLLNGQTMAAAYPGIRRMSERAAVYYPPVDFDLVVPPDRGRRDSSAAVVVGTLANINPDQGLEYLIDAASILSSRPDIAFEVYGAMHATHLDYARDLATRADRGARRTLFFRGETEDPSRVLSTFDIFVISSVREGTTTTAIEAMAAGLPVVATRVGGVPEIVADGETGLLVEPHDPRVLATAIERLVDDRDLRLLMGRIGRSRGEREFGLARTWAAYRRAYGIALDHHRAARERTS
jgi:glycosyltransferase involved in cell wall biosynthesis